MLIPKSQILLHVVKFHAKSLLLSAIFLILKFCRSSFCILDLRIIVMFQFAATTNAKAKTERYFMTVPQISFSEVFIKL